MTSTRMKKMPDDLKFRIITNLGACALALGEFEDARDRLLEAYRVTAGFAKGYCECCLSWLNSTAIQSVLWNWRAELANLTQRIHRQRPS